MARHIVEVELKRVQGYIFEVPRLKAMLGANALVGEVLRHELVDLAISKGAHGPKAASSYPEADPKDPLTEAARVRGSALERDDPKELATRGVLVRDGGRLKAVFPEQAKAEEFAAQAEATIAERLPGVLAEVVCKVEGAEDPPPRCEASELDLLELPVLEVCRETGHGVASWSTPKDVPASVAVRRRYEAGERFYKGETRDIVGLLREPLGLTEESGWSDPDDLGELCGGGYLALVYADGNDVGERYRTHMKKYAGGSADPFEREAYGERFFASMRVATRQAVVEALKSTFPPASKRAPRPYAVLMLGGDDLLIACRAESSLRFVEAYAKELATRKLADGEPDGKPLTVAAGVAIASSHFPFHRLHELAESLVASAKRLYRALPADRKSSVVDWQIVTQAAADALESARRTNDMRRYKVADRKETLVLSGRPYRVLQDDGADSLESLLDIVRTLTSAKDEAARSALRALRVAFEAGRLSAEMAFTRLDEPLRKTLAGGDGKSPWRDLGSGRFATRVLDIVGLREIAELGRKRP